MTQPASGLPRVPDSIQSDELLGREVFTRRHKNRAENCGKIHLDVFLDVRVTELSVDRLQYAPDSEAVEIGDRNAANRGSGRTFYGWAVLTVVSASQDQRRVRPSPLPDGTNPYHADIVLPEDADPEFHARQLAECSCWRPHPSTAVPP